MLLMEPDIRCFRCPTPLKLRIVLSVAPQEVAILCRRFLHVLAFDILVIPVMSDCERSSNIAKPSVSYQRHSMKGDARDAPIDERLAQERRCRRRGLFLYNI
jgi:hypothetical protein